MGKEERVETVVTAEQMKRIDAYSIREIGIPSAVLMERAALALADCAQEYLGKKGSVAAVCGFGNNGGDGIAAARILSLRGWRVSIFLVGDFEKATAEAKEQLAIAEKLSIPVCPFRNETEFTSYTVLIDAIFGIGLVRPVQGEFAQAAVRINESGAFVIAADIASGVSSDNGQILGTAVRADVTVTFGCKKAGQLLYPGAEYTGRLVTADIGFPEKAYKKAGACFTVFTKEDLNRLPKRPAYSNKGTFGKVLICAGSRQMCGAAYLSASAAYRMGAGLVRILTEEENYPVLAGLLPEALITGYDGKALAREEEAECERIRAAVDWAETIVVGPGIGTGEGALHLVEIVAAKACVPCIFDADALNLISARLGEGLSVRERVKNLAEFLPEHTIITPHLKELSRLLNVPVAEISGDLIDTAGRCTYNNKLIYVLKDARTVVAQGEERYLNLSGNEGMATGGSGDVLTGMIAGLLAGGCEPYTAARLGVYIHGLAGDAAVSRLTGRCMLAGDIIRYLPDVLKEEDECGTRGFAD